jgi:hypothetical protein
LRLHDCTLLSWLLFWPTDSVTNTICCKLTGGCQTRVVDCMEKTSDNTVNDAVVCASVRSGGRPRVTDLMHARFPNLQAWCEQAEHPKEMVSRHTVRPGTIGSTLVLFVLSLLERSAVGSGGQFGEIAHIACYLLLFTPTPLMNPFATPTRDLLCEWFVKVS